MNTSSAQTWATGHAGAAEQKIEEEKLSALFFLCILAAFSLSLFSHTTLAMSAAQYKREQKLHKRDGGTESQRGCNLVGMNLKCMFGSPNRHVLLSFSDWKQTQSL